MIKINTNRKYATKNTKQYSRRVVRRVPRAIKSTGLSLKVEYDDIILWASTDQQPSFGPGGTYTNFTDILQANPAFISQTANYQRYKISGCSFTATPCFTETLITAMFPTSGIPNCFIQQYPTLTSQSVGSEVEYSDNNLNVKPLSLTQSKYWSYKSNYMIGIGSGVGTWNQCNQTAAQQGQFSVRKSSAFGSIASAATGYVYSVRMCLYVLMDGKTR